MDEAWSGDGGSAGPGTAPLAAHFACLAALGLFLLLTVHRLGWRAALRYERFSSAIAAGVLVTLVVLLTARWTTYAYFADIAPLVLALPVLLQLDSTVGVPVARAVGTPQPPGSDSHAP